MTNINLSFLSLILNSYLQYKASITYSWSGTNHRNSIRKSRSPGNIQWPPRLPVWDGSYPESNLRHKAIKVLKVGINRQWAWMRKQIPWFYVDIDVIYYTCLKRGANLAVFFVSRQVTKVIVQYRTRMGKYIHWWQCIPLGKPDMILMCNYY